MTYTIDEILSFIEENDVKFIRLAFTDILGTSKNIAIMAGEFARVYEEGASFDSSAIAGMRVKNTDDLLLFPDLSTMSVLPWRGSRGMVIRFYCDVKYPNGCAFEGDGRYILKKAENNLKAAGFDCLMSPECEFYLFERDEAGEATDRPQDYASYLDIAPLDRGENVRRDICFTLHEMGIEPESSHHEQGYGQNEIVFNMGTPLVSAENCLTFRTVVHTVAAGHGLYGCFMPKPVRNFCGSGLHVKISLFENGVNLFDAGDARGNYFIAGILSKVKEISACLNPTLNSYERLGDYRAPVEISGEKFDREHPIRIPPDRGARACMELRSPDSAANPYIAFALIIEAGLWGIKIRSSLALSRRTACRENLMKRSNSLTRASLSPRSCPEMSRTRSSPARRTR